MFRRTSDNWFCVNFERSFCTSGSSRYYVGLSRFVGISGIALFVERTNLICIPLCDFDFRVCPACQSNTQERATKLLTTQVFTGATGTKQSGTEIVRCEMDNFHVIDIARRHDDEISKCVNQAYNSVRKTQTEIEPSGWSKKVMEN